MKLLKMVSGLLQWPENVIGQCSYINNRNLNTKIKKENKTNLMKIVGADVKASNFVPSCVCCAPISFSFSFSFSFSMTYTALPQLTHQISLPSLDPDIDITLAQTGGQTTL